MKTLLHEIGKCIQNFSELVAILERRRRDEFRGGFAPTVESILKHIRGILKIRYMKDLFPVQITEKANVPFVTCQSKHDAWNNLQETLLGKTLVFTDNHNWTDTEIVQAYRA